MCCLNMPKILNAYLCLVCSDEKQQDMSLSISTNGNASITVSVEVNGTIYSGLCEGGGGLLYYISLININNVLNTSLPSLQPNSNLEVSNIKNSDAQSATPVG